ncbi:phospho-N-acetylmuramoyl-pentapeptide-transferase [bacterium]|nr:phospho-N-acetylmuramoyl-pentapeptide-transferase [bacterium]
MLYHLLFPLSNVWSPFNLFQYITFRAVMASIFALLISFLIGPWVIRQLTHHQIGEQIRSTGPQSHHIKKGTPTMGGVMVLTAILLPTLLFAQLNNVYIQIIIIATLWMGLFGFIDDYLKVIKKKESGLIARYKLAGQITLGIIISAWMYFRPEFAELWSYTSVPFFKDTVLSLGWFYPIMIILVITGFSNAVNLTDGLDGLASGLLAISFAVFTGIAYVSGRVDFSNYLNIEYLPGAGELTIFAAATVGACVGFLWFNSAPASVFMGDVGSLSTGSALGTMAVLLKKELLLFIIGGVFVIEALSVLSQWGYFRYTKNKTGKGKRLWKMAPIHHHYELKGWTETKVVIRFWIIGLLFALFSLTTFKIR